MKKPLFASLAFAGLLLSAAAPLRAQQTGGNLLLGTNGPGQSAGTFAIRTITLSTPKTPEYNTQANDSQTKRYTLGTWLQVDVEFSSTAHAAEVGLHYSILINGTNLVADQTLVDVNPGQSLFTTVFVAPRTLTTLLRGQPLTPNAVQNIDVQILRPGVTMPLANKMLKDGPAFYQTAPQVPGFVLNKSQTPFAPLWYDHYEVIKDTSAGR